VLNKRVRWRKFEMTTRFIFQFWRKNSKLSKLNFGQKLDFWIAFYAWKLNENSIKIEFLNKSVETKYRKIDVNVLHLSQGAFIRVISVPCCLREIISVKFCFLTIILATVVLEPLKYTLRRAMFCVYLPGIPSVFFLLCFMVSWFVIWWICMKNSSALRQNYFVELPLVSSVFLEGYINPQFSN